MGKYGRLVGRIVRSVDYWAQAAMRRFVADIDRRMVDQDISRTALAQKLGASSAYVTKVMRGDVNFTLETMTKLALAVGGKLQVKIIDRDAGGEWDAPWVVEKMQVSAAGKTKYFELPHLDPAVANQPKYQYETLKRAA
jgi:transcriptional regulator with XRE-family HTH domain